MSTPRATQQGLGSATTLKGRPSPINTGYLAEGIDKVAGEREKGLANKALDLERDRIKTEKVLSQKSDLKFSANQKEYARKVKELTGSKEFAFLSTGEALNKSQEIYLELLAQERTVLSDIAAKGKAGFKVRDPETGISIPYEEYMIAKNERLGSGNLEGHRSAEKGEIIETDLKITDPTSELAERLKDFQNVTKSKGAGVEGGFIVNKETFSQEDADKFVNNIMQDSDFIMSYADKYRAMQGGRGRRDDYIPTQEFQDYMRGEVEGIAREKVDVLGMRQLRIDDKEPPKEFETKKEVRSLGDGQTKEVVVAGIENKSNIEYGGKTVTIVSTTEDAEGNMVLVGQYKEGGDTEKVVIDPSQVKDQYTEEEWSKIENTFAEKVLDKAKEAFSVDVWMDEVSSGESFQDEVAVKIKEQYPELNDIKDPLGKDDVAFTYKGKEYSFNVDKGKQGRKDLKKLLNKIEKERVDPNNPL